MMGVAEKKQEIREKLIEIRKEFSEKEVCEKSRMIIEKLKELEMYNNAEEVMFYVSLDPEVDTKEFIKSELDDGVRRVLVPFVEGIKMGVSEIKSFDDLEKGEFGVLEPVGSADREYEGKIDLILIPGVAFDNKGGRVGYGKAYYDYFLKKYDESLKIGLAFDEQIVKKVPVEDHDVKVDIIITDKRVIRCGQ